MDFEHFLAIDQSFRMLYQKLPPKKKKFTKQRRLLLKNFLDTKIANSFPVWYWPEKEAKLKLFIPIKIDKIKLNEKWYLKIKCKEVLNEIWDCYSEKYLKVESYKDNKLINTWRIKQIKEFRKYCVVLKSFIKVSKIWTVCEKLISFIDFVVTVVVLL